MKHGLLHSLGLVGAALLALGAGSAAAQVTTANGPYYATPSWDQKLPASTRFIVLANWVDASYPSGGAAVLDRETGLVWERSPSAVFNDWWGAELTCNTANTGGRMGWRLPTLQELTSLLDPNATSAPRLPTGHPFQNVRSGINSVNSIEAYWSATSYDPAPDPNTGQIDPTPRKWVASFNNSAVAPANKVGTSTYLLFPWCVHAGQGVDVQ